MVDLDLSQVQLDKVYVVQLDSWLIALTGVLIRTKIQWLIEEVSMLTQRESVFVKISNANFTIHTDILNNLNINLN